MCNLEEKWKLSNLNNEKQRITWTPNNEIAKTQWTRKTLSDFKKNDQKRNEMSDIKKSRMSDLKPIKKLPPQPASFYNPSSPRGKDTTSNFVLRDFTLDFRRDFSEMQHTFSEIQHKMSS